jgi:hypothetical protein
MSPGDLDQLLQKFDAAARFPEQQVRVVFQTREGGDKEHILHQSASVLQIPSSLPYARLFQEQAGESPTSSLKVSLRGTPLESVAHTPRNTLWRVFLPKPELACR